MAKPKNGSVRTLPKAPTGIQGLDEITGGGLPRGRPTLVSGSAGCGKTLLAMEFLIRGATQYREPGLFVSFEETSEELVANVGSLGFDVDEMARKKLLRIDFVRVERSEIEETGEYDLEGLFIRLGHAIDSIGAKRVVLDTIETLFGGFASETILRSELRRLFRWLKDRGVTAVITGERGESTLTRHGLEEYVSDCVIVLDHRVTEQLSTRRLRIVKYRGTVHGTNEYPFLIDEAGICVLPITSVALQHQAPTERVSTGVERLDTMLGGGGVYRGSSVLISGTAGTGKTSLAAHFAHASTRRGETCLYIAFEESEQQVLRNMQSIGLDLRPALTKGLLRFHPIRPTAQGMETHLAMFEKLLRDIEPRMVVVDPITNLVRAGSDAQAEAMLMRLADALKSQQVTAVFTSLVHDGSLARSETGISSLIDTWIALRDTELGGERNRGLNVLKSRGMAHSNQVREFLLTGDGIALPDVYVGSSGVLTGTMRMTDKARERARARRRSENLERSRRELKRRRDEIEAHLRGERARFEAEVEELELAIQREEAAGTRNQRGRAAIARSRSADEPSKPRSNGSRVAAVLSKSRTNGSRRAMTRGGRK
ncbi:MAG TPA: circadian clock protein KaiC [Candidatus Eisenbacteria bacterium]|nr:circadian clock protein KaiC [Candidatus Eisenbacteria bacterium]